MSDKPKITEVKGLRQETSDKPFIDIEGKIKRTLQPEGLQWQTEKLSVKETVIDEGTSKEHERKYKPSNYGNVWLLDKQPRP